MPSIGNSSASAVNKLSH